ncbi:MAG: hypothetical protein RI947_703 [Candidatus Parcubacteria bacterium]
MGCPPFVVPVGTTLVGNGRVVPVGVGVVVGPPPVTVGDGEGDIRAPPGVADGNAAARPPLVTEAKRFPKLSLPTIMATITTTTIRPNTNDIILFKPSIDQYYNIIG